MSAHKFRVGCRVVVNHGVSFFSGRHGRVDGIDGFGRFSVRLDGDLFVTGPFAPREMEKEDGDDSDHR